MGRGIYAKEIPLYERKVKPVKRYGFIRASLIYMRKDDEDWEMFIRKCSDEEILQLWKKYKKEEKR